LFELKSHENLNTDSPSKSERSESHKDYEEYLMSPNSFIKGKRLIDPVTGRVEGDDKSDDSYEMLERSSVSSKRSKFDHDTHMEGSSINGGDSSS
jgi:hypothetical protein